MTGVRYGATPQEWQDLVDAGLADRLLPIVSNTNLKISPKSKMQAIGKSPSIKNWRGEVTGFPGWTTHVTTAKEIESWSKDPDYGIGFRLGDGFVAIDCDCSEHGYADPVMAVAKKMLGEFPIRFREGTARFLIPLRVEGQIGSRQYLFGGKGGPMVEILGKTRQFKVIGMHKDGVSRYYWQGRLKDAPAVSPEQFEAFCSALEKDLGAKKVGKDKPFGDLPKGETHLMPSPLADWLRKTGRVISEPEPGKLIIVCPWADEHTDQSLNGRLAVFFQAGYRGINHDAFCCLHAHCQDRSLGDFIAWAQTQGYDPLEGWFEDVTKQNQESADQRQADDAVTAKEAEVSAQADEVEEAVQADETEEAVPMQEVKEAAQTTAEENKEAGETSQAIEGEEVAQAGEVKDTVQVEEGEKSEKPEDAEKPAKAKRVPKSKKEQVLAARAKNEEKAVTYRMRLESALIANAANPAAKTGFLLGKPNGDMYIVDSSGLFLMPNDQRTEVRLGDRLDIVGIFDNGGPSGAGVIAAFDYMGKTCEVSISIEEIFDSGRKALFKLVDCGYRVAEIPSLNGKNHVIDYVYQIFQSGRFVLPKKRRVTSVGWVDETFKAFALPDGIVQAASDKTAYMLDIASARLNLGSRGTLDEWKAGVAQKAMVSRSMSLAAMVSLAGPLLRVVGAQTAGFHLYAASSTGKTSCARVAASCWGKADADGELGVWRATDNGLELNCVAHSDLCLVRDEISQASVKSLRDMSYMVGNGRQKDRASKNAELRRSQGWVLTMLSTGEKSYCEARSQAETEFQDGESVRIIDIPACAENAWSGVLDTKPQGCTSAAGYVNEICQAAESASYGTAGPAFVRVLVTLIEQMGLKDFRKLVQDKVDAFVQAAGLFGSDAVAGRVGRSFAVVSAAGELAAEQGILPWKPDFAQKVALECFQAWKGGDAPRANRIREIVREMFALPARFPKLFAVAYEDEPDMTPMQSQNANECLGLVVRSQQDQSNGLLVFGPGQLKRALELMRCKVTAVAFMRDLAKLSPDAVLVNDSRTMSWKASRNCGYGLRCGGRFNVISIYAYEGKNEQAATVFKRLLGDRTGCKTFPLAA